MSPLVRFTEPVVAFAPAGQLHEAIVRQRAAAAGAGVPLTEAYEAARDHFRARLIECVDAIAPGGATRANLTRAMVALFPTGVAPAYLTERVVVEWRPDFGAHLYGTNYWDPDRAAFVLQVKPEAPGRDALAVLRSLLHECAHCHLGHTRKMKTVPLQTLAARADPANYEARLVETGRQMSAALSPAEEAARLRESRERERAAEAFVERELRAWCITA
jgi:hypothetical protein